MTCQTCLIVLKKIFSVASVVGLAKTHLWLVLITWNAQMSPSFKVFELHSDNLPWDLDLAEPPAWTDFLTSTVQNKEFLLITVRLMSGLSFLKPLNGSSSSPLVVKANCVSNPGGCTQPWTNITRMLAPLLNSTLLPLLTGLKLSNIRRPWKCDQKPGLCSKKLCLLTRIQQKHSYMITVLKSEEWA